MHGQEALAITREVEAGGTFRKNLKDHPKLTGILDPTIFSDLHAVRLDLGGSVPIDTMHLLRNDSMPNGVII